MTREQTPAFALDRLEETFQGVLLGETPREALLPALAEPGETGARETKADLLNIYASGYVARLEEVMGDNFEGLRALMGDEDFSDLCHAYLRRHPSRVRSVRWTGQHLETFLRETAPWSARADLADIAAFDWAQGLAFDAPGLPDGATPMVDEAALGTVAPERWPDLRFGFQDALRMIEVGHAVDRLFQDCRENNPVTPPAPLTEMQTIIFWRNPETLAVHYRVLDDVEARTLEAARSSATFADMCETLAETIPVAEAPLEAVRLIRTWLAHGLIATLSP